MKKIVAKMLISIVVLIVFANFSYSQTAASTTKTQLVNEIVEQTFSAFPMESFEIEIEKVKIAGGDSIKVEIPKLLVSKVEENSEFSAEKKEEIKAKIPAFGERFGDKVAEIIAKDLDMTRWVKEALAENFTKNFTLAELKKVNFFMKGKSGKAFFEAVKEEAAAKIEEKESGKSKITDKQAVGIEKFMNSPLGTKFMNLFSKDTETFLAKKVEIWSEQMLKNLDEQMKNGELGKMLEQFLKENFG